MSGAEVSRPERPIPQAAVLPQQPAFSELVALNAGVVLEPLANDTPVAELDLAVVQGISELPTATVKTIVRDHTEMPETSLLLAKFKEMRSFAEGSPEDPIIVADSPRPKSLFPDKARPQKPLMEIIQERIFEGTDQPRAERLPLIIAKAPSAPQTLGSLETAFQERGYDLNDPSNAAMAEEVRANISKGYGRYLFSIMPRTQLAGIQQVIAAWVAELGRPADGFWLDTHKAIIIKLIADAPVDAKSFDKITEAIVNGSALFYEATKGSSRFQTLIPLLMKALNAKALKYPKRERQAILRVTQQELIKMEATGINRFSVALANEHLGALLTLLDSPSG